MIDPAKSPESKGSGAKPRPARSASGRSPRNDPPIGEGTPTLGVVRRQRERSEPLPAVPAHHPDRRCADASSASAPTTGHHAKQTPVRAGPPTHYHPGDRRRQPRTRGSGAGEPRPARSASGRSPRQEPATTSARPQRSQDAQRRRERSEPPSAAAALRAKAPPPPAPLYAARSNPRIRIAFPRAIFHTASSPRCPKIDVAVSFDTGHVPSWCG